MPSEKETYIISRVHRHIEREGEGASIRPWFWILCLFLGPMMRAIVSQWYTYIAVRELISPQLVDLGVSVGKHGPP